MYPDDDKVKKQKPTPVGDQDSKKEDDDLLTMPDNQAVDEDLSRLAADTPGNQTLLNIKQQALSQLSPLIDNLEQSPEQHFRTLMMIIQETDNVDMIDKAYATALQLKNPKEKAQALLAIANEINYFTSK